MRYTLPWICKTPIFEDCWGAGWPKAKPANRSRSEMKKLQLRNSPLLASPPRSASASARSLKKGGVAASSKQFREATDADAAGVVFLFVFTGTPPRPREQRMLREIFLIARPPLLS